MIGLSMQRSPLFCSALTEVLSSQDESFINFQLGDTEQIHSNTLLWGKPEASTGRAVAAASAQSQPAEGRLLLPIPTALFNS